MSQIITIKKGSNANLPSLVLQAGEPAFAIDTGKLYIGDGTNKILINPDGGIATEANKLTVARTITLGGDASGSIPFDGSSDVTLNVTVDDDSHNHTIATITGLQANLDAKAPLDSPALIGTPTAPTASLGTNTTQVATTQFVTNAVTNGNVASASKLTTARTITASGDATSSAISFDGSANISIPLTLANSGVTAGTYPKVTVDAKGRVTGGASLVATDIPTLDHTKISDFDTQVRLSTLNQMATPTTDLSLGGYKITNLATPVSNTDAVNKAYVDSARAGLSIKDPVRVATTSTLASTYASNVLTSMSNGAIVIDGVTLALNDRVLVKDQTTGSQNGIYIVSQLGDASNPWKLIRALDADTNDDVTPGMATWINEGTTQGDSRYVLTTNNPITLDSTSLVFTKDFQASDIIAGTGITKSGSTLSLANSGVTASTYKSVTVDAYGRVTGGTNPTTLSGYGITDAVLSSDVVTSATANKVLKLDASAKLPASITGNSSTTNALATARTIAINGDVNGIATSFDGTSNISISATISTIDGGTF